MASIAELLLSEAAEALGFRRAGPDAAVHGCAIDSRTVKPGELFVALEGEQVDGHDYVTAARDNGAAAAIVSRIADYDLPVLIVDDVHSALMRLATYWRARWTTRVAAVTGSNGKTTTKEILAAICTAAGPTLATAGNFNNNIGLPVTLLRLAQTDQFAVIEMGANHIGEIAELATIAAPHVGIITHCGPAHLEGFGSIEGVARAKGELVQALPQDGTAVLNADDPFFSMWRESTSAGRVISFGLDNPADVTASYESMDDGLSLRVRALDTTFDASVALLGRHNVMNVLAAVAAATAFDIAPDVISAGLGQVSPVSGRLKTAQTAYGATLIDDSYNANPASLRAGLEVLAARSGRRWAVLGDMAELGDTAAQLHASAGEEARSLGIERLLTLGPLSAKTAAAFGEGAEHFDDVESLAAYLSERLQASDTVLVKGSRSMAMERVVDALTPPELRETA